LELLTKSAGYGLGLASSSSSFHFIHSFIHSFIHCFFLVLSLSNRPLSPIRVRVRVRVSILAFLNAPKAKLPVTAQRDVSYAEMFITRCAMTSMQSRPYVIHSVVMYGMIIVPRFLKNRDSTHEDAAQHQYCLLAPIPASPHHCAAPTQWCVRVACCITVTQLIHLSHHCRSTNHYGLPSLDDIFWLCDEVGVDLT
jgi:hypothetical protein